MKKDASKKLLIKQRHISPPPTQNQQFEDSGKCIKIKKLIGAKNLY